MENLLYAVPVVGIVSLVVALVLKTGSANRTKVTTE